MSGGARVRSGPPQDPNALRRDRDASLWTRIPAARTGDPPPWPLPRPTKRELAIWAREWARGQAVMWEAYGWHAQVAMYVRHLGAAEDRKAPAAARALVLRHEDTLGISIGGLQRNKWIIAADEPVPTSDEPSPRKPPRGGRARRRLEVLEGGA